MSQALNLRRLIVGRPLATSQIKHERLSKIKALAVFSSDALSSVAYGPEEVMLMLVLAGSAAASLAWPIGLAITALIILVSISYYQTVHAYPGGGGSYIVAHDNLGQIPGLTAAAALLIDYVLTVSVSVTSGVAALTSAFPGLFSYRFEIALFFVALIMILNLRGIRESGTIFSAPTYVFILSVLLLLGVGLARWIGAGMPPAAPPRLEHEVIQPLTIFLVLRAFSSGCTALTGIEAISNGIPAFKPPEADNAGKTLLAMGALLATMFLGITFLSHQLGLTPNEITRETLTSQLGRMVFGHASPLYFVLQVATTLILILAANTSFADFPRLSSILARDKYMPHQFSSLGDRLVFSNGIFTLALASSALILLFGAETTRLIPLYAVGVFLSFTLSQAGMVARWMRLRTPHWQVKAALNGLGALVTGVVAIVIAVTKFLLGAWIVIVLIPIIIVFFLAVNRHYKHVAEQLSLEGGGSLRPIVRNRVIVPIADVHKGVIAALNYARAISNDVTAVYVEVNPEETARVKAKWSAWGEGVRLQVIQSEYRSIVGPLIDYVSKIDDPRRSDQVVTIVLPQFVPMRRWHNLLHNQTALLIHMAFLFRRDVMVTDVPFHLQV